MSDLRCTLCGSTENLCEVMMAGDKVCMCKSCYEEVCEANESADFSDIQSPEKNETAKNGFTENKSGYSQTYTHNPRLPKNANVTPPTNWTSIFKTINMILLVVTVISGLIGGAIMFEEMFDGGFLLGAPIGALAGLLAGGVTVSFSMVIVEISQKLSAILEELKKQQ